MHPCRLVCALIAAALLTLASTPAALARSESASRLFIVHFAEAPLLHYAGDLAGLPATSPAVRGERRLDARSLESRAYLDYLTRQQDARVAQMGQALGRSLQVVFRYRAAANGVAVALEPAEAAMVRRLAGVVRVIPDRILPLLTDRGPLFIGADQIWDGSATGGNASMGEGVIVGVIDSGINMDHPSFSDDPVDGHTYNNPLGPGTFLGWCDPANPDYDPSYACNDKLIGAWDYTDAYCAANPSVCSETDGPEDNNGHGSHTASTAAGNTIDLGSDGQRDLSGVAPHANVIAYDACFLSAQGQGLCPFSNTSAAADQALLDGVDAINYSIAGGLSPWNANDIDSFFLELVGTGTYVAAAAGNSGPTAATASHLGPWVSTTGASTHDRLGYRNELADLSGGTSPPADITGASLTGGYGPAAIVSAANFSNGTANPIQCLSPFPADTWKNSEIVLCDRGTIARVLKCANVAAGGAGGCVLANVTEPTAVADAHVIPAINVSIADGNALRTWLGTGTGHTATITDSEAILDPDAGDLIASFSSRGPNNAFDALKPDVSTPGANILAAVNSVAGLPPPEFALNSGTSMASPHNAGSGTLMKALFPSWSPSQIKSAIMLTAQTALFKEDGATDADPFDFGAGRVDLSLAPRSGLVLDESYDNYVAANPAFGGQPRDLNLASLQKSKCAVTCRFTRIFESVAPGTIDWTISGSGGAGFSAVPSAFTLAPGETRSVELTFDVTGLPLGQWVFGRVDLTPGARGDAGPALHMPIAAKPANADLPDRMTIAATASADSRDLTDLTAIPITNLTLQAFGLVQGTETAVSLNQDPTNASPFNNLAEVYVKTVAVAAGTKRLIAITSSDESPDVDLYLGSGATPTGGTILCSSTSSTADERCELTSPAAGTYWILVQNWQGSASQPDAIRLVHAVVPDTAPGNLVVSGPSPVPGGTPFALHVSWSIPSIFPAGTLWFGGVSVGTAPGSPGNLGTILIDLVTSPEVLFSDGFESGDTSAWSNTVP